MKKHLILCEGIHDLIFLSLVINCCNIKFDVFDLKREQEKIKFNGGEGDDSEFKVKKRNDSEAKKLRLFKKSSNKSVILIKNEGNQDNCIEQFLEIVDQVPENVNITLLLDYDHGNLWEHLGNYIELKTGKRRLFYSPINM